MANVFTADPTVLRSEGGKITERSEEFKRNIDRVYSTVHEMVGSDFLSPDAVAIANEIDSYRNEFDKMAQIISAYGEYCLRASTKVINNQETNISNI